MPSIKDPSIFHLNDVRLAFPKIWEPETIQGGSGEPRYSATFLLDVEKHAPLIERMEEYIERIAFEHWRKKIRFESCIHDGADKPNLAGYGDGVVYINSARSPDDEPPALVDGVLRDLRTMPNGKRILYGGCYVNGSVKLWVQDNKYGKRVNAQLRAIQFLRDGPSFMASKVDIETEFDSVSESDSDFERVRKEGPNAGKKADWRNSDMF